MAEVEDVLAYLEPETSQDPCPQRDPGNEPHIRGWLLEAIKNIYFEFRPGPPESPKSAGKGGPGPPRYRRTALGNRWFSSRWIFGHFSAKLGPEIPLDRRGSPRSAGCTKNQTRRPILRPFRGHVLVSPDSMPKSGARARS